jgi:hypothetical protein
MNGGSIMKNQVNAVLTFEDKTFKNDQGETVDYISITSSILGETVRFSVKKEDKSLLQFLRKKFQEVK